MTGKSKEEIVASSGNVSPIWACQTPRSWTQKPDWEPRFATSSTAVSSPSLRSPTNSESTNRKVSALLNYKLEGFSVERLMNFLVRLGHDVEIVVKNRPRSRAARIAVKAA